ncbi:MAG: AbrB/MazE/SpoVT family DNA-binding domain-containing protein [Candidatus Hodarchaeales archaeon]
MRKTTRITEKVSTVGIRNQVTLPKAIRESLQISEKTVAFISVCDDGLRLTTVKPEEGVFNRIKISEKGQLVIPKNLRESLGIREGTNLLFMKEEKGKIKITKLKETEKVTTGDHWNLLVKFVRILGEYGMKVSMDGKAMIIKTESGNERNIQFLEELEKLTGNRFLLEKIDIGLKLTPLE